MYFLQLSKCGSVENQDSGAKAKIIATQDPVNPRELNVLNAYFCRKAILPETHCPNVLQPE